MEEEKKCIEIIRLIQMLNTKLITLEDFNSKKWQRKLDKLKEEIKGYYWDI